MTKIRTEYSDREMIALSAGNIIRPSDRSVFTMECVNKTFKSGDKEIRALSNVDLEIPRNKLTFFRGENGSGKTTALYMLGGYYHPDDGAGKVFYEGDEIRFGDEKFLSEYRLDIAWIFQKLRLLDHLTVLENIILPLNFRVMGNGISKEDLERNTMQTLESLGIKSLLKQKPRELSAGNQQLVALARAFVCGAKVILADEPTGSLDKNNTVACFDFLKALSGESTVVVISHDTKYVEIYADVIYTFEKREAGNGVKKERG